jgi:hypothetical protein
LSTPSLKPLNSNELAAAFGVSRVTVCKWLKQGIPHTRVKLNEKGRKTVMFDFVEASKWVAAHSPRVGARAGIPSSRVTQKKPETDSSTSAGAGTDSSTSVPPATGAVGSMFDPLRLRNLRENPNLTKERLEFAELLAFRLYVQAVQANDASLQLARLRVLADIVRARRDIQDDEEMLRVEREKILALVTEELRAWLEPIRALLDAAPKILAPRCNPTDPAQAEKSVDDWVQTVMLPALSRNFSPSGNGDRHAEIR